MRRSPVADSHRLDPIATYRSVTHTRPTARHRDMRPAGPRLVPRPISWPLPGTVRNPDETRVDLPHVLPASIVGIGPQHHTPIAQHFERPGAGCRCCAGHGAEGRQAKSKKGVGGGLACQFRDYLGGNTSLVTTRSKETPL